MPVGTQAIVLWKGISSPFPACSAELVTTRHVNRFLEDREGAHTDTTLSERQGQERNVNAYRSIDMID